MSKPVVKLGDRVRTIGISDNVFCGTTYEQRIRYIGIVGTVIRIDSGVSSSKGLGIEVEFDACESTCNSTMVLWLPLNDLVLI